MGLSGEDLDQPAAVAANSYYLVDVGAIMLMQQIDILIIKPIKKVKLMVENATSSGGVLAPDHYVALELSCA